MTNEAALHLQVKSRFTDSPKAAKLSYREPTLTIRLPPRQTCRPPHGLHVDLSALRQHMTMRLKVM